MAAGEKRLVPMKAGKEAAVGSQEKHVFINTPHGIRSLRRLWVPGEEPEHTVVGREAAQSCGMRANGRQLATGITGPTGVANGPDTDYEMFLLADDLPGRTAGHCPRGGLIGRVLRVAPRERPREALGATARGTAVQNGRMPVGALGRDDLEARRLCRERGARVDERH